MKTELNKLSGGQERPVTRFAFYSTWVLNLFNKNYFASSSRITRLPPRKVSSPFINPLDQFKHDLASPLTTATLSIHQLLSHPETDDPPLTRKNTTQLNLERACQALKEMGHFFDLSTRLDSALHKENFPVALAVQDACAALVKPYPFRLQKNLSLVKKSYLYGDKIIFQTILTHLLNNALESYPEHHPLRPVDIVTCHCFGGLMIAIIDQGCGLAEKQLKLTLSPGFSTKRTSDTDSSRGIGLSEVRSLLKKDFSGQLELLSRPNLGTAAVIFVPQTPH